MLKISMIPILTRMIAKLNFTQTISKLKELDIFTDGQSKMSNEQLGVLAVEIIASLTPQLDKIGADIPEFVAVYKGVSIDEAKELDVFSVIEDIKNDDGLMFFFKNALHKKVEQDV